MKKIVALLLVLVLAVTLISCKSDKNETEDENMNTFTYSDIKPEEAKRMLETEENVVLLDVRTPSEYTQSHIPNSVLIPLDTLQKKAVEQLPDKDSVILVYCRSGNRSRTASKILSILGYKNVRNLGGIIDWPYETQSGN
jgi:rhodanese-related sulfurtransferase